MDPAAEFGPTIEPRNPLPATEKGVLQGILGILGVIKDAHDHRI
jgi:hypothetical protein